MKKYRCVLILLLIASVARADVESGPKPGEKIGELKVSAITGAKEGKDLDYAAERKDEPTIYLFVNAEKFGRPMARFLRKIDEKIGEASDKAEAVAVWVGGEAAKSKEYLPRVNLSLKFAKTALTVFDGNGPNGWGINSDAHLTAVVAVNGKVVKSFPFVSVNETDADEVLKELTKAIKK
jgi:hypothetical protein